MEGDIALVQLNDLHRHPMTLVKPVCQHSEASSPGCPPMMILRRAQYSAMLRFPWRPLMQIGGKVHNASPFVVEEDRGERDIELVRQLLAVHDHPHELMEMVA